MTTPAPNVTDHDGFERQLLELRTREKAHTREGDAIAAARRRLPMTEVPPDTTVIGPAGPVPFGDVFEGRDDRRRGLPQRQRDHLRHSWATPRRGTPSPTSTIIGVGVRIG